jgi:hypothetical protein
MLKTSPFDSLLSIFRIYYHLPGNENNEKNSTFILQNDNFEDDIDERKGRMAKMEALPGTVFGDTEADSTRKMGE